MHDRRISKQSENLNVSPLWLLHCTFVHTNHVGARHILRKAVHRHSYRSICNNLSWLALRGNIYAICLVSQVCLTICQSIARPYNVRQEFIWQLWAPVASAQCPVLIFVLFFCELPFLKPLCFDLLLTLDFASGALSQLNPISSGNGNASTTSRAFLKTMII